MRRYARFCCIDWSGARGLMQPGIAVAVAETDGPPRLIAPPARHWSRPAVLNWLGDRVRAADDMLIGMDISFGFPFVDAGAYFPGWDGSPLDAPALWAMVEQLCADDPTLGAHALLNHAELARHFRHGRGQEGDRFGGGIGRLRHVERYQREARQANSVSVFNLVGAGQVGKASLSGMRLLHALNNTSAIWPFAPPANHGPQFIEIYTSIAARAAGMRPGISKMRSHDALNAALAAIGSPPVAGAGPISDHAADALLTAAWMARAAADPALWHPPALTADISRTEGWTFGII